MSKKYALSQEDLLLKELKRQLESKSNLRLSCYNDCKLLSLKFEQAGVVLSPLTISRCFGITKSPHKPFISTLDLMCSYLGYTSFNQFSKDSTELLVLSLSNPELNFHTGDYSFNALELAIRTGDWKSTAMLLEAFDPSRSNVQNLTFFLGKTVRDLSSNDDLLSLLAKNTSGRAYYFEAFVDEDDPNNYFSDALMKFYLEESKESGDKMFGYSFIYAKKIYKRDYISSDELNFVDQMIHSVEGSLDKLHFHQLSRLFEIKILWEGLNLNRLATINAIVDDLLEILPNYSARDQSWLVYRTIKALGFTSNFRKVAKSNLNFKNHLINLYSEIGIFMNGVGDLALQYAVHSFNDKNQLHLYPPGRIRNPNFNETDSRIAIENATALIYANDQVKSYISANLPSFLKNVGHEWIFDVGNYSK